MTVAAVILAASPAAALADADGTPAVRRIADAAWAGGATPVIVVSADPDGALAAALSTAEVTLLDPTPPGDEEVAQVAHGMAGATGLVAATTAVLVWPAGHAWADAETVTTLIATHGAFATGSCLVPTFGEVTGFPVLVPVTTLEVIRAIPPSRPLGELAADLAAAGVPFERVVTGDPGVTHDLSVPRASLPPFEAPPRPDGALEPEWGAPAADQPDDAPPTGLARVSRPDSAA